MERPLIKLEKLGLQQMRRSKLEMYVDILKVLMHNGPLMETKIKCKSRIINVKLNERMNFLIKHDLVEQRSIKRKTVFAVTQNGINILKYFGELEQAPPIAE
jgi:predicted transcriptional regulator